MISQRRQAHLGLIAALGVFAVSFSILLAGAMEQPDFSIGQIGSQAAPFRLPDLDGRMVSLASMRGSVVVLCFADSPATQPSDVHLKRLAELEQRYPSDAVKLVSIYTELDAQSPGQLQAVRQHIEQSAHGLTTLLDPTGRVAQQYCVQATPAFVIIDPEGTIRYNGGLDHSALDSPLLAISFNSIIDGLLSQPRPSGHSPPGVLSNIR